MVNYEQREKLMRDLHDGRTFGLAVVFKCTSCLILLVVVAVVGTRFEMQPQVPVAASTQAASTQD